MTKVMNIAFGVDKLSASEFLNASWKVLKLLSKSLQERPSVITFYRFDCRIDSTQEDYRFKQDQFLFQYYLQLPQQYYVTVTNKVEDISSP